MKKFLNTFAAIAASFAAQSASASVAQQAPESTASKDTEQVGALKALQSEKIAARSQSGDIFNFVLKRSAETGQMMAWHESHASHASHASHSSHYSSRS